MGRKRKESENLKALPKFMTWKCIDNFDKVSDEDMFLVGKMPLSLRQREVLKPIFEEMRLRWTKKIKETFSPRPKHLTIAGGNYTYFFVLPKLIKWIKKEHPYLSVRLKLLETREGLDLANQESDLVLAGLYPEAAQDKKSYHAILKAGYTHSRISYDDEAYFAASVKSVEEFGSKENTINKHDILFGRLISASDSYNQKTYLFTTMPEGREKEKQRIVVDLWYMGYLFMKHHAGIWHIFKSIPYDETITQLHKNPVSIVRRFFVYKKGLHNKYKQLARIGIRVLNNRGG
jgi:hypothetical protein